MILSPTSRGAFKGRSADMLGRPTSRPTSRAAAALRLLLIFVFLSGALLFTLIAPNMENMFSILGPTSLASMF